MSNKKEPTKSELKQTIVDLLYVIDEYGIYASFREDIYPKINNARKILGKPVIKICKMGNKLNTECPDCRVMTCGCCSHGPDNNCLSVLGRRGWRKLGDYDS